MTEIKDKAELVLTNEQKEIIKLMRGGAILIRDWGFLEAWIKKDGLTESLSYPIYKLFEKEKLIKHTGNANYCHLYTLSERGETIAID